MTQLKQCTRSHPHENMDEMCELRTEIARLTNELAQLKRELVGYAGVKVWVGGQQVCRVLTQTEIHHAINPWRIVEMTARSCIAKLKEKNT